MILTICCSPFPDMSVPKKAWKCTEKTGHLKGNWVKQTRKQLSLQMFFRIISYFNVVDKIVI